MDQLRVVAMIATAFGGIVGGALAPAVIARIPPEHADLPPVPPRPADMPQIPDPVPNYAAVSDKPLLGTGMSTLGMLFGALVGWQIGWHGTLLPWLVLLPVGTILAVVDWHTRLLPTFLIAPAYVALVVLVLLSAALDNDWSEVLYALLGWAVVGGFYLMMWLVYPRGIGYGDVRLAGLLGLGLGMLGWRETLVGGYAGLILGAVLGLVLVWLGLAERKAVPFGPFMVVGAALGVIAGGPLMHALGW